MRCANNPQTTKMLSEMDCSMKFIDILLWNLKYRENVGSIYRLAYQFGIKKIFSYKSRKPGLTDTPKHSRHMPTEYIENIYDFMATYPYPKYVLETGGINEPSVAPTDNNFLLCVGNEGYGVPIDDQKLFDKIFTLKSFSVGIKSDSYNVAIALEISLYLLNHPIKGLT
jgi:tRNA G18 (ribose-2'-O)-methylase SpoU